MLEFRGLVYAIGGDPTSTGYFGAPAKTIPNWIKFYNPGPSPSFA